MSITTDGVNQKKIEEYFSAISTKHQLNMDDLVNEWNKTMSISDTVTETNTSELLKKKLKPELQEICKSLGLSTSGTKDKLIERITNANTETDIKISQSVVSKKTDTENEKNPPIVKKLMSKIPVISIRRNQFGNHEHSETHLIFDPKTKKVIGRQNDDGSIDNLTSEDIDICNQYKFDYLLPENLDKTELDDVSVDELDEDEEIIESEEELDEELLEDELLEEEEEEEEEEEDF